MGGKPFGNIAAPIRQQCDIDNCDLASTAQVFDSASDSMIIVCQQHLSTFDEDAQGISWQHKMGRIFVVDVQRPFPTKWRAVLYDDFEAWERGTDDGRVIRVEMDLMQFDLPDGEKKTIAKEARVYQNNGFDI